MVELDFVVPRRVVWVAGVPETPVAYALVFRRGDESAPSPVHVVWPGGRTEGATGLAEAHSMVRSGWITARAVLIDAALSPAIRLHQPGLPEGPWALVRDFGDHGSPARRGHWEPPSGSNLLHKDALDTFPWLDPSRVMVQAPEGYAFYGALPPPPGAR